MKYTVSGRTEVEVTVVVNIDASEIEDMGDDDIRELAKEKAAQELCGLSPYCGNNGTDKIVGVSGSNQSISPSCEIEWDTAEPVEE